MFPEIENFFWRAKGEGNKDEIKNRAIFFEFSRCNIQSGKDFLNLIVGSESESTGPEKGRPAVIVESEELKEETF